MMKLLCRGMLAVEKGHGTCSVLASCFDCIGWPKIILQIQLIDKSRYKTIISECFIRINFGS